jgi:hypothetical protein
MRGAGGLKIAVLRKGRAKLVLIQAAVHVQRYTPYRLKGDTNRESKKEMD